MVVGETSQTPVKDTTLMFQYLILTSTNYTIWSMLKEVLLGIDRVWDAVDPGLADAKKNNIVMGLLFQSIPEDLVLQIGNLKSGKEMWEAIKGSLVKGVVAYWRIPESGCGLRRVTRFGQYELE
ncbi:hypothetical protein Tco_0026374 [Tanacetum coccineum]